MRNFFVALFALTFVATTPLSAGLQDRLYGRITTRDGRVLEGPIRWDKNEASWLDVLDATRKFPERNLEAAKRAGLATEAKEIRVLGVRIARYDESNTPFSTSVAVRFGQIRSIEPLPDNGARLILKSGQEVVLNGGADVGSRIRNLIIEDATQGAVELRWRDLETVEFLDTPSSASSQFGDRLWGTLLSRRMGGFQGLVCWDVDEIFTSDLLDGNVKGKKRAVPFGEIASIQRNDARSAKVVLKSGEEILISGTNDVNDENRGILVMDPNLGVVRVDWEQFDRLILEPIPELSAKSLANPGALRGVVYTEGGQKWQGRIRWDNDEEYGWEILDGEARGVQYEIEFGLIRSIEKASPDSSAVTLTDGRSFELTGSNDVGQDNKGIYITADNGEVTAVAWKDFRRVEFQ